MKDREILSGWKYTDRNHRGDFESCPHCGEKLKYKDWEKHAIILATDEYQKHGYIVIVNECPNCFKKSWIHEDLPLSGFGDYPKKWIKASQEELSRRELHALREWKKGLCGECEYLESGEINTSTFRYCTAGCGPVQFECESFNSIKG